MSVTLPEKRYLPLDTSRQEIRLLEIVSTNPEIACRFHPVSLLDNPSFCALSYVWGDEGDTQDITVNDARQSITSSLANALEYAVFHWKATFPDRDVGSCRLWADAICINQADNQEKGQQVQLMKEVYSMAEVVFCALDFKAPEKEMQLAFHAITSIATGAEEDGFEIPDVVSALYKKPKRAKMRRVTECLELSCQLLRHLGVTLGSALKVFCSLTYWKRAWIFQEVVLARRPVFIYRTLSMELETLFRAESWISAAKDVPTPEGTDQSVCDAIEKFTSMGLGAISGARTIIETENMAEDAETRQQFQMARRGFVFSGGLLQARDPKDYVYALLGVADLKLKPDYSPDKSLESVCIDLCAEVLNIPSDFPFEFLFFLPHAGLVMQDELESSYDFASWVPNLPRREPSRIDAIPPRPFEQMWVITPQVQHWMDCGPSSDVFIRGRSLFVRAVFISTILDLGPVIRVHDNTWLSFVWSVFKMLNSRPLDTRHSHPLVTLAKALGAECQRSHVWEMDEVFRIIRALQYLLIYGQPRDEKDGKHTEPQLEYVEPFGEEFLSCIGLGSSWRRGVLDKPPRQLLDDELSQKEQDEFCRASISDFLSRISDEEQFEVDFGQAEKDAETMYLGKSRLARAPDGGLMFVPWCAEKEDHVVLIKGVMTFSLIRKVGDYYLHVGRCSSSTPEWEAAREVNLGERELVGIELR
ncbi:hypothetical protein N0V84_005291 [Fusarium piperis]|uniref:Heterokaryon incompatibility domain-containing protein n=1 Tax=Fusarium piperis TaxID=1435070 RepID=A0A9W9BP46_9HYPO|nr:hypothetical protein N0V84_005291 [Fusarium piperis]